MIRFRWPAMAGVFVLGLSDVGVAEVSCCAGSVFWFSTCLASVVGASCDVSMSGVSGSAKS